eukprot:CAMPEP_0171501264 /NCGR_PEP_ID=MMETSP0958-20121227/9459_1 /TAXON_ID=87120 /ORGANISM="Aurantiochytrium limacinum, Strain ATCCMYA-1381" /LENGTH=190 /DNA_ID=CAMNT_0012036055 /DNA_START=74 /DNA_END=646 /DNA_ORIENTATION=-
MSGLVKTLGAALVETGQALQRAGLRASDHVVVPHAPYRFVGAKPPAVLQGAEVDPSASLIGSMVRIGARAKIAKDVVVLGEEQAVNVGCAVSVGAGSVLLASSRRAAASGLPASVEIGVDAIIGERCVLESCLVGDEAVIGDDCVVSAGSYVEARAHLLPGTVVPALSRIPSGQVWGGNPAAFVSDVEEH